MGAHQKLTREAQLRDAGPPEGEQWNSGAAAIKPGGAGITPKPGGAGITPKPGGAGITPKPGGAAIKPKAR